MTNNEFIQEVLRLTNEFRAQNGLHALVLDTNLQEAAQEHSESMALQDFFSHTGQDGSRPWDRAQDAGYESSFVGENIAAGGIYDTPEKVVQGWIDSPGHRANMLNADYNELGVGYYFLENDTGSVNYNTYWTQVFGKGTIENPDTGGGTGGTGGGTGGTNPNTAPVASNTIGEQTATEDSAFSLDLSNNFSDADGDTLTYTVEGLPDGLSLDAQTGVISGTPTNAAVGTSEIRVTADDGKGAMVETTFELTVANTNDAPTVSNPLANQEATAGTEFSLDVSNNFADIDAGDTLTYSAEGLPDGLSLDPQTGLISGTPTNAGVGTSEVIVTANDGNGGTASNTFQLAIADTSDPAPDPGDSSPHNDFVQEVLRLTNEFRAQNGLDPLVVDRNLVEAAQEHSESMALQDFFSHTGQDGSRPWDRAQDAGYESGFVGENIAAGYRTPEQVVEGWKSSPGHRANMLNADYNEIGIGYEFLENDTGNVNYNSYWTQVFGKGTIENPDTGGGDGGNNGGGTGGGNPNVAPVASTPIGEQTAAEDSPFNLDISNNFSDADGDSLTYSAEGLPDGLSLDAQTGVIGGTPTNSAVGTNEIKVTANDGNGGTVDSTFELTVANTNDDPTVASPIADQEATAGTEFSLDASNNFADIDAGDTLTYAAEGLPDGLSLDAQTGLISGTPTNAAVGTSEVIVTANDGNGGTVSDTFQLAIASDPGSGGTEPTPDNSSRIWGTQESDRILGGESNQIIKGRGGDDTIDAGAGNDFVFGNRGNDTVIGGQGNDKVKGGRGDDTLIGVDSNLAAPGVGEIDTFWGNSGADTFVLGDSNGAYYNSGGTTAQGFADFAFIRDFNASEDTVQLHGSADNYELGQFGSNAFLFHGESGSNPSELIGVIRSNSELNLSGSEFTYV